VWGEAVVSRLRARRAPRGPARRGGAAREAERPKACVAGGTDTAGPGRRAPARPPAGARRPATPPSVAMHGGGRRCGGGRAPTASGRCCSRPRRPARAAAVAGSAACAAGGRRWSRPGAPAARIGGRGDGNDPPASLAPRRRAPRRARAALGPASACDGLTCLVGELRGAPGGSGALVRRAWAAAPDSGGGRCCGGRGRWAQRKRVRACGGVNRRRCGGRSGSGARCRAVAGGPKRRKVLDLWKRSKVWPRGAAAARTGPGSAARAHRAAQREQAQAMSGAECGGGGAGGRWT